MRYTLSGRLGSVYVDTTAMRVLTLLRPAKVRDPSSRAIRVCRIVVVSGEIHGSPKVS